MIIEVTMPVLGLTMEQGTIAAWLKGPGDSVQAGEPLLMVETDKATSDAPSPATGILARVLRHEGDIVAVGAIIALLAETEADLQAAAFYESLPTKEPAAGPAAPPPPAGALDATPAAAAACVPTERVMASPRARARARELGVDLPAAAGVGGRLTEKDIPAPVAPAPSAAASPPPAQPELGITKLSRARKIIAERMTFSATTIPQVTYTLRCDVTDALALRRSLRADPGGDKTAVSFDALVVKAAALALAAFPGVNAQWVEGQGIRQMAEVNIAVAVDLEEKGLVIPIIHGADGLNIRQTAAELDRLVAGAKAGKLGPDDYAGGTFTVTSLASLGVESFNPIIVPPQAAILGVGSIVTTPVFQRDEVAKRRMVALSLTTDHRMLDGGPSARFLSKIRDLLEQPAALAT